MAPAPVRRPRRDPQIPNRRRPRPHRHSRGATVSAARRSTRWLCRAAIAVLIALAPTCDALIMAVQLLWPDVPGGPVVESVEWMSTDADQIVHATVERVTV